MEATGRYLLAGQGVRVRKRGRLVRAIGNILIIIGVVMLVGIGGWYGYTQWDNQRFKEELAARGGLVEPPLAVEETPTPVPAPPATERKDRPRRPRRKDFHSREGISRSTTRRSPHT